MSTLVAAKRRGRGAGLVFAALTLLGFHHAVQFGESLGDTGRADPVVAVWGPFLLFGSTGDDHLATADPSWQQSGPTSAAGSST